MKKLWSVLAIGLSATAFTATAMAEPMQEQRHRPMQKHHEAPQPTKHHAKQMHKKPHAEQRLNKQPKHVKQHHPQD